jgi:hypothetical protein
VSDRQNLIEITFVELHTGFLQKLHQFLADGSPAMESLRLYRGGSGWRLF